MPKEKGFVGIVIILIIIAVVAGAFYYFYQTTLNVTKTPSIQTQENNQLNETIDNWQTYENKEAGFSIKYPAGWVIKEFIKPDSEIKQVEISTAKNLVVVGWGKSGFGGACPEGEFKKIRVDGAILDSCYQNSDGLESWGLFYLKNNGLTYGFMAYAENQDRNKVLKMLESFKFI